MVLAACGVSPARSELVGGWKFEQSGTVAADGSFTPSAWDTSCACSPQPNLELHFASDGTVSRIGSGPSQAGSYAFTDDRHIRLELAAAPGEVAEAQTFEVLIAEQRLTLRSVDDGQTLDQRYVRVE